MRALALFALGLILGPLSWATAYAISGTFEPFDNTTGFFVCQAILALALFVAGLRAGMLRAFGCLVGVWVGMNAYAYLAGSSETRAWIVLLFSSLTLLMFPLAAAIAGGIVRAVRARRSAAHPPAGR